MQGYPKVAGNMDGTYTVKYMVTHAANYTLTVQASGLSIKSSPFNAQIKASVLSPGTVVASGEALYKTHAGAEKEACWQA